MQHVRMRASPLRNAAEALVRSTEKQAFRAVAGRSCWIISDGKAGNDTQTKGVADALQLDYEIKPVDPTGMWRLLSPWGPIDPREHFGTPLSQFRPPWPDFAFAIGRLTIPYIRALKRSAGSSTFTVILQDPKVSAETADMFWVPEHDRRRGPNVVTTLTAPHGFSPERLAELRTHMPPAIAALPAPRVAVALGGPNKDYVYDRPSIEHLASALASLGRGGAGLMITPSRRTPPEVVDFIRQETEGAARIFWDGEGDNPYPAFIAHADAFIVPADSINMTGEPCATGKPIYVFEPKGGSAKFDRFHAALRRHGATRPLPARLDRIDTWSYPLLNSAGDIAAAIAHRWQQRRHQPDDQPALEHNTENMEV
jgi:hypothetical protein